jgi:hypothetical protein
MCVVPQRARRCSVLVLVLVWIAIALRRQEGYRGCSPRGDESRKRILDRTPALQTGRPVRGDLVLTVGPAHSRVNGGLCEMRVVDPVPLELACRELAGRVEENGVRQLRWTSLDYGSRRDPTWHRTVSFGSFAAGVGGDVRPARGRCSNHSACWPDDSCGCKEGPAAGNWRTADSTRGAYVNCWIDFRLYEGALALAKFYIRKYGWQIRTVEEAPLD